MHSARGVTAEVRRREDGTLPVMSRTPKDAAALAVTRLGCSCSNNLRFLGSRRRRPHSSPSHGPLAFCW
ncbi:hypothetical protein EYF80_012446 [Liparis tanakae]|uniref:Uncharacterized protein n=1 Tax=Liparis tanakae TaxID=230148 RepID=A0A4Z2IJB5_9TELE|nr:hypothetical protein EYF80_012446 [Liparis tanakae]